MKSKNEVTASIHNTPRPQTSETGLYYDGRGRITCADLPCAGMTAFSSGMHTDLHGARIYPMPFSDAHHLHSVNLTPECESCHRPALKPVEVKS